MQTLRVRFTRTYQGEGGVSIAAGTEIELPKAEAERMIAQGKAEELKGEGNNESKN
ncbi:MAG: hypothetical protein ABIW84_08705 [Ilumatobacteraceae bacterium]